MGHDEELALAGVLQRHGMTCIHELKQRRITDFLKDHPSPPARAMLQQNKDLPRERLTYEVDVFAWREGHWGALAIEDKAQSTPKTLEFWNSGMTLHNGAVEFPRNARNLHLQCTGSGLLGQAYSDALGLGARVVPMGVVDYELRVHGTPSRFVVHEGVVFVNRQYFEWFVREFLEAEWPKQLPCNHAPVANFA